MHCIAAHTSKVHIARQDVACWELAAIKTATLVQVNSMLIRCYVPHQCPLLFFLLQTILSSAVQARSFLMVSNVLMVSNAVHCT